MKIINRQEGIENGLIRYYTGKPCRHGHYSERYTASGACIECVNEAVARERAHIMKRRAEVAAGGV